MKLPDVDEADVDDEMELNEKADDVDVDEDGDVGRLPLLESTAPLPF